VRLIERLTQETHDPIHWTLNFSFVNIQFNYFFTTTIWPNHACVNSQCTKTMAIGLRHTVGLHTTAVRTSHDAVHIA